MSFPEDELVEFLMECDLTQNDATVYLWLSKHNLSNPSEIANGTGIKRPRVYDSLKRLMERGFVVQEMEQKRPQYKAINARVAVKDLENQISFKKQAVEAINKYFINQPLGPPIKGIFFYNTGESLRLEIQEALEKSKDNVYIMAVAPVSFDNESLLSSDLLIRKSAKDQKISLILNINSKNWEYCLNLSANKIKIYHYPHFEKISTLIHLIDDKTLVISYYNIKKGKIALDYGFIFTGKQEFIQAFTVLFQGFIKDAISLQDRIEVLKKSIIFPQETLKEIYGLKE